MKRLKIHVIGAGMAGSEAAFFLANQGHLVCIHEMRPEKKTQAHQTGEFAELVCSNSLKSKSPFSAPGMLKAEMQHLNSLILQSAHRAAIPGGEALTVNREVFSKTVTETLKSHPLIQFISEEVYQPFDDGITLFATGPLTTEGLSHWLQKHSLAQSKSLYFYDAISPIVDASSLNYEKTFLANRYDKGGEDAYLNCPLTEQEYSIFIENLLKAEKVSPKVFEQEKYFQACQPIEVIAETGKDSLRFGPMKPVGLKDPKTGEKPYAALQLRPENHSRTAYNLVGFQTKLKYPEQLKVFRLIPALENVEFLRLGSIHRNTYVCAPEVLRSDLSLKNYPKVYLAGQITGVEGYVESAATGLLCALFIQQRLTQKPHTAPPADTAMGALLKYILTGNHKRGSSQQRVDYRPSNIHFGLIDPAYFNLPHKIGSKEVLRQTLAQQAFSNFKDWHSASAAHS